MDELRTRLRELEAAQLPGACGQHAMPSGMLAEVFDLSPVGMALLTPSLGWLAVNRSLLDTLGVGRQEVMALRLRRLLSAQRLPKAIEIARREPLKNQAGIVLKVPPARRAPGPPRAGAWKPYRMRATGNVVGR